MKNARGKSRRHDKERVSGACMLKRTRERNTSGLHAPQSAPLSQTGVLAWFARRKDAFQSMSAGLQILCVLGVIVWAGVNVAIEKAVRQKEAEKIAEAHSQVAIAPAIESLAPPSQRK